MGLLNMLLGSMGGGEAEPKTLLPAAAPLDIPELPTELGGVTATARSKGSKSSKSGHGYDNLPELTAIHNVQSQYPQESHGNGLGLSNLVGAKGTLRDILGTLGDAFLIQSGHDPIHAQAKYRQQIADAAAGFDIDPAAAASRIAATGAPGSMEEADKLYSNFQTQKLREAQQADTTAYHQSQQEATQNYRDVQQQDKVNQQLQRLTPYVGAIANDPSIKTKEDYTKAYGRATTMAKRIDPNATGADLGLVDPEDWRPGVGTTTGMTQGANVRNQTSNRSITERAQSSAARNAVTARGQNLAAGKPTSATITSGLIAKQNRGEKLTPAEQAIFDKETHIGTGKTSKLAIPGLTVGGGGSKPTPTAADLAYLRAHPEKAAAFKAHFGTQ